MKTIVNGVDVGGCELLIRTKIDALCGLGGSCKTFENCQYRSLLRSKKETLEYIRLYNEEFKKNEELREEIKLLKRELEALKH